MSESCPRLPPVSKDPTQRGRIIVATLYNFFQGRSQVSTLPCLLFSLEEYSKTSHRWHQENPDGISSRCGAGLSPERRRQVAETRFASKCISSTVEAQIEVQCHLLGFSFEKSSWGDFLKAIFVALDNIGKIQDVSPQGKIERSAQRIAVRCRDLLPSLPEMSIYTTFDVANSNFL